MGKLSIIEVSNKPEMKQILIDELCKGITNTSDFRDACHYVFDKKIHLFDIPEFNNSLYDGEDDILDLIMPSFRRAWGKIYVQTPTLFKSNIPDDKRLELFQNLFNIDDFVDYLIFMFKKTKGCLSDFNHIDRTPEHLTLIVDNYIASLVKKVLDSGDIKKDIREAKLKNIL